MNSELPAALACVYERLGSLHRAGQRDVVLVRHRVLDVIRVLTPVHGCGDRDPGWRERCARAAQAASELDHPNIARVYDFAIDDAGKPFVVVEAVDGQPLCELMRRQPPSVALALELAAQTLRALAYLHRRGVAHGNLSPRTLMVEVDADREHRVKMVDVGIGAPAELSAETIRYRSPEQLEREAGAPPIGAPSDLYSFGIVFHELLVGRFPLAAAAPGSTASGPGVLGPFEDVVMPCLEKAPQRRPPSAEVLLERLHQAALSAAVGPDWPGE